MATQPDGVTGYDPQDPEAIRRDIERTRASLADDVDRLADRTSPKRVARRNWENVHARLNNVKESVMGAPRSAGETVKDKAGDAADSVQGAAASAADTVRDAPHAVARRTRGNPLAVGLIAFGAGLVVASLFPPSEAEKQAGDKLQEHSGDLLEKVKEPLQDVKRDVTDSARESAQQVKETARDAAQTTARSTRETAQTATNQVRSS
jgi:hypothetical protein